MKLVDIARAVNEKLKPLNIPIVSDDIRSGFERPAFFVQLMVIANSESSTMIAITIHYFPTDKKQLELLKMTDKLNEIFSDYTINLACEDAISISEISIDMIDNVLQYRIDTTIDKDVNMFEEKDYVKMQILEMEGV